MEKMHIKTQMYSEDIKQIANNLIEFVCYEFPDYSLEFQSKIQESVLNLLDFDNPRVMVYGVYNSGKSTLINALMKEEVAQMADRPMTDAICEYDRGDYILVDSPGIDAPIQHEAITNDFLDKCHIILYVISSKGGFESKYNYEKMANLIDRNIPFVIVLNERGYPIEKKWSKEEKSFRKAQYEQELREVQYKIIDNLKAITGDNNITDKYEVYTVNAKKGVAAIQNEKFTPEQVKQVYKLSKIENLDKRIYQLVRSGDAYNVFKQPVSNLKDCFDIIESKISTNMREKNQEDFSEKINLLRQKQYNLKDEMSIFIRQATSVRVEELVAHYTANNAELQDGIELDIFTEIEDIYMAKLAEVKNYISKNLQIVIDEWDSGSNLNHEFQSKDYSVRNLMESIVINESDIDDSEVIKSPSLLDIFKSQRKKDEERKKALEQRADLANTKAENKLNEEIRLRQQARQIASSDMFQMKDMLTKVINRGINEKFDEIILSIQELDCENKELLEYGRKQIEELNSIKESYTNIENTLY